MPFAAVFIRSGRGFDLGSISQIIDQRNIAVLDMQIFFLSIYCSLNIVLVFTGGYKRPLLNIAVPGNQKDSVVVEHVIANEHIDAGKAVLITSCICRHSSRRSGIVIIGDAEGLAIKFIRVVHCFDKIAESDFCSVVIIFIVKTDECA